MRLCYLLVWNFSNSRLGRARPTRYTKRMESVRVDAQLLKENQNKIVRIIGKIGSASGTQATLESNGQNVTLLLSANSDAPLKIGTFYEIIGKATTDDLTVRVLSTVDFGQEVNERAVSDLVKFSHKCKEIFS